MTRYYFTLCLLLNITPFILSETNNISKLKTELTVCQHYTQFFENNNISAKIVDVINGISVNLLCHYCEDRYMHLKQTWYYKKRGLNKPNKIITDLENVIILPSQNLLIRNFSDSLSGIYTCEYTDEFMKGVFTYVIDEVFEKKPKVGLRDEWQTYKRNELDKINDKFKLSNVEPFVSLRNKLDLLIELITVWDDWGPCEPVGKQKGLRKSLAMCRLKILPFKLNKTSKLYLDNLDGISRFFLLDKYGISCRSAKLNKILPAVSRIVNVPDYKVIEACDIGTDSTKFFRGKKIEYKYTAMKQIGENGHLNLICPEIEKYSRIEWFKNYVLLNSSFRNNIADSDEEPHLTIDSYSTLYILHATKNEEALYSCNIDGEHILLCDVRVVSKSRLINRGLQKRCMKCRSRGELGSCGDPFPMNVTEAEDQIGIHVVACPSGWCGKMIEGTTGAFRTDDYGAATQRMCLQRSPSDDEERCAYTMWNHKKVYMCFCNGDLCNSAGRTSLPPFLLFSVTVVLWNYYQY